MDNGMVIMGQQGSISLFAEILKQCVGFTGGANLQGTKGDHVVLAPPYNITREEVEIIVDRLVKSIEEVIHLHPSV
jgi:adenosylmethionine-8-amino-7-oxononanoate aminotransferase